MSERSDLSTLLPLLAVHAVVPPAEALPPNDDRLHRLLADLACGTGSLYAETLRMVAAEFALSVEELAHRAEFLLACLVLPASGSYYEVLGVAPDASTEEIRKRWAALIQRYHPDRLGGTSNWLDGQVRRLVEAYQTLKDPERRRAYDAERVVSERARPGAGNVVRQTRLGALAQPMYRWWIPLTIAGAGLAAGLWIITRPALPPLPRAALPGPPRLLETWTEKVATSGAARAGRPETRSSSLPGVPKRGSSVASAPGELPSLRGRLAATPEPSPLPTAQAAHQVSLTPPPVTQPVARSSVAPPAPAAAESLPVTPAPAPIGSSLAVSPPASPSPTALNSPAAPSKPAPAVPEGSSAGQASEAGSRLTPPPAVVPRPAPAERSQLLRSAPPPLAPAAPRATASVVSPLREEPLALIQAFLQAYERRDLPTVMSLFGAAPREGEARGRAAVEALYVKNFAILDHIRYDLADLHVLHDGADGEIVVRARFRIRATHAGLPARPLDVAGLIRWLLRNEEGTLRIVGLEYEVEP